MGTSSRLFTVPARMYCAKMSSLSSVQTGVGAAPSAQLYETEEEVAMPPIGGVTVSSIWVISANRIILASKGPSIEKLNPWDCPASSSVGRAKPIVDPMPMFAMRRVWL